MLRFLLGGRFQVPPHQPDKDDEMVAAEAMKELEMFMPSSAAAAPPTTSSSSGSSSGPKRNGNRYGKDFRVP